MKKILYGSVASYTPTGTGFIQFLTFTLTPGTAYNIQYSPDNSATWTTYGTLTPPPATPPLTVFTTSAQIAVPGGWPVRMQEQ